MIFHWALVTIESEKGGRTSVGKDLAIPIRNVIEQPFVDTIPPDEEVDAAPARRDENLT